MWNKKAQASWLIAGFGGLVVSIILGAIALILMKDPLFKIITFIVALIILIKFLRK